MNTAPSRRHSRQNLPSAQSPPPAPSPPTSRFKRALLFLREDLPCYALALVSAALLRLAFPHPGLGFVAWFALVPLLMALRARTGWRAWWIAFFFGTCFSYCNIFWLHSLLPYNPFIPIGLVFLGLALGLWTSLSGWGWSVLRAKYGTLLGPLLGAVWWIGVDWLRTLGPYGFPWGGLGMTQSETLSLLQVVSTTGVFGLTFLILLMNGFLADLTLVWLAIREQKRSRVSAATQSQAQLWKAPAFQATIVTLFLIFGVAVWGSLRMRSMEQETEQNGMPFRIAALQPNVPQRLKMASYASPDPLQRQELQTEMTSDLLETLDDIILSEEMFDLVVTPESVVTQPYFNRNTSLQRALLERTQDLGAPLYLGADDSRLYTEDGAPTDDIQQAIDPVTGQPWRHDMFVSAWLIRNTPRFDRASVYHKIRLVPFGEWLPWFDVIPGFQEKIVQVGSFTPGDAPALFEVPLRNAPLDKTMRAPSIRISGGICFESIFSNLHRDMASAGADVLLNITNDGWYEKTSGPYQHFAFAVLRAVETGRPLIRCANTGITAIIAPTGKILDEIPFYEKGTLITTIPVQSNAPQTLYTRLGDKVVIACLILGMIALVGALITRPKS